MELSRERLERLSKALAAESEGFDATGFDAALVAARDTHAAATAASYSVGGESSQFLACGLLTHRCFETDPFFEQIRCDGPRLVPPPGTGLGCDELLEKLPWKALT